MKKVELTMLELKEKLIKMKDEDNDYLYPSSITHLGGDYQMIDRSFNDDYNGSTLVYIKDGIAIIPHFCDEYGDCMLYPEDIQMIDEHYTKAVKKEFEYKKKELENLGFVLDKQKIRMLFTK